jgi:uncharacterized protein YjbI with pentapeptide repeats
VKRRREIDTPDVPSDLEPLQAGDLVAGSVLEGVRAGSTLVVAQAAQGVQITESVLVNVDFRERRLPRLRCADVRFEGCDFAGAKLDEALLTRVEFVRCRMTGTVLSGAQLQDVQVTACSANMLALRMVQANFLRISDSSLREADLYQAKLQASLITGSDLTDADFTAAQVPELELHGSTLDGLVGPSSLRGAVITHDQLITLAGALASEVGITVE